MSIWVTKLDKEVYQQVKSSRTKLSNCVFGTDKCEYLGHKIGQGGISPLKSKVVAVREMPRPQTKKEIRTFLGMTGYYRRYIQNYASIAAPLSDLTRKCMPDKIVWTDQTQQVFDTLKTALTSSTVMRNLDPKQTFILQTDASNIWVGAVLSQGQEEHPIAYFSWKLLDLERNYSAVEKECCAVVLSIKHFDVYLLGKPLILQTDHKALKWLQEFKEKNSRLTR